MRPAAVDQNVCKGGYRPHRLLPCRALYAYACRLPRTEVYLPVALHAVDPAPQDTMAATSEVPAGFTAGEGGEADKMNEQLGQAMDAILTPEAADRLKRVELVRKEDAMKMKMKLIEMVGWASRLVGLDAWVFGSANRLACLGATTKRGVSCVRCLK